MRKVIVVALVLVCALALVSCGQEVEEQEEIKQIVINNIEGELYGPVYAQMESERLELRIWQGNESSLRIWTKDPLTDLWPEHPVEYRGRIEKERHGTILSETKQVKEILTTVMYTVDMESVHIWDEETSAYVENKSALGSMVNAYDGVFDVDYVSGWKVVYEKTPTSGFFHVQENNLVVDFVVPTDGDKAPSALIGFGRWRRTCPW